MNVELDAKERGALLDIAQSCLCSKARKAARAVTRFYDRHFAGTELEPGQFTLLVGIRLTEPVPMARLAEHLGLDRTTFTRNLGVLERDGLAIVARGDDARQRLISLTDEGRRRLKAAMPRWEEAQQAAIFALGKQRFSDLSAALSLPAEFNKPDRKEAKHEKSKSKHQQ
jgi:DNA-binding MarR family transcriptional regulator